jgi:hypothetical protein
LAARMRRIEFTIVVLPTPGPPVITRTLAVNADRSTLTGSRLPGFRRG